MAAFSARQWQANNAKNQLVLGPNGAQAVISAENFGQVSVIKLPDPGKSETSFILADTKAGTQTINGDLTVTGTLAATKVTTTELTATIISGGSTINGDETLNGNLIFTNTADRFIKHGTTDSAAHVTLTIQGSKATTGVVAGDLDLKAGSNDGASAGGELTLAGGAATGAAGGAVKVTTGAGTSSGDMTLATGAPTAGGSGFISLATANAVGGNNKAGSISLTVGASTGTADGNEITLTGGKSSLTSLIKGGDVEITGGEGIGSAAGGDAELKGGSAATGTGTGGNVDLDGGAGSSGNGGAVNVQGGQTATGTGGAISVTSGVATGLGTGGVLSLQVGTGGTANGAINIGTVAAPTLITVGQSSINTFVHKILSTHQVNVVAATPAALTSADSGKLFTFTLAAADINMSLPAVATSSGVHFRFIVGSTAGTNKVRIIAATAVTNGFLLNGPLAGPQGVAVVNKTNVDIGATAANVSAGDSVDYECDGVRWYVRGFASLATVLDTS